MDKVNWQIIIELKDKTLWVTEGFGLDDGINNLMSETRFSKESFIKEIHSIIAKNSKKMEYIKANLKKQNENN